MYHTRWPPPKQWSVSLQNWLFYIWFNISGFMGPFFHSHLRDCILPLSSLLNIYISWGFVFYRKWSTTTTPPEVQSSSSCWAPELAASVWTWPLRTSWFSMTRTGTLRWTCRPWSVLLVSQLGNSWEFFSRKIMTPFIKLCCTLQMWYLSYHVIYCFNESENMFLS